MGEYWIYQSLNHKQARVHKGDCPNCNHGNGSVRGSSNKYGRWHGPYADRTEAFRKANALDLDGVRGCNACSP